MNANYDRIQIRVRKGKKAKIENFAKSMEKSTQSFIIDLIEREAEKNGFDLSVPPTPSQLNKKLNRMNLHRKNKIYESFRII